MPGKITLAALAAIGLSCAAPAFAGGGWGRPHSDPVIVDKGSMHDGHHSGGLHSGGHHSDGHGGTPTDVPEPSAVLLFGLGVVGVVIGRIASVRRKRKA